VACRAASTYFPLKVNICKTAELACGVCEFKNERGMDDSKEGDTVLVFFKWLEQL
jgi:hypothetical protein